MYDPWLMVHHYNDRNTFLWWFIIFSYSFSVINRVFINIAEPHKEDDKKSIRNLLLIMYLIIIRRQPMAYLPLGAPVITIWVEIAQTEVSTMNVIKRGNIRTDGKGNIKLYLSKRPLHSIFLVHYLLPYTSSWFEGRAFLVCVWCSRSIQRRLYQ